MSQSKSFPGWDSPSENWSKLPHDLVALLPKMKESELKVTLYILRHTWGYGNYETYQAMTTDEIMNGRRVKGGDRMDSGTGLSKQSIITGTKAGIQRGTLEVIADRTDRARIKKGYKLRGQNSGLQRSKIWTPEVKNLDPDPNKDTYKEKGSPSSTEAANGTKAKKKKRSPTRRAIYNAAMEEAFSLASGLPLPKRITAGDRKKAGSLWNTPLWNLYDLSRPNEERQGEEKRKYVAETLDNTVTLIGLAVQQMRADELTIAAPASIEKVATSLHATKLPNVADGASDFWEQYK